MLKEGTGWKGWGLRTGGEWIQSLTVGCWTCGSGVQSRHCCSSLFVHGHGTSSGACILMYSTVQSWITISDWVNCLLLFNTCILMTFHFVPISHINFVVVWIVLASSCIMCLASLSLIPLLYLCSCSRHHSPPVWQPTVGVPGVLFLG